MLFPRLPRCRCLYHRYHGVRRKTRIQLALWNVLRHHFLHYSRDLHVSVWNYHAPVRLFCLATRILSHQELINSPCDERWMSHQEILAEHVVDIHKVVVDFRDAFERLQSSSSQSYGVNKYFSSQSRTLGTDEVRKMLSRNKLRWNGILLLCKKLLIM